MPGQQAAQQPGGGAGVAHVQHIFRLLQKAEPTPSDPPVAGPVLGDGGAQRPHGRRRPQHIFAFQQTLDPGFTDGQRRKHERAMTDALVAGNANGAVQLKGGSGGQGTRSRKHSLSFRL